jgi:predicted NAD/FAD-binding protein
LGAIRAQRGLPGLNTTGPVYFCGSYFKYGFHEDAFTSALDLCRTFAGEHVWSATREAA